MLPFSVLVVLMMTAFHFMFPTVYVIECLALKKAVLASVAKVWLMVRGSKKELPIARQSSVYNGREVPLDSWSE